MRTWNRMLTAATGITMPMVMKARVVLMVNITAAPTRTMRMVRTNSSSMPERKRRMVSTSVVARWITSPVWAAACQR